jgi:hypothetical protein
MNGMLLDASTLCIPRFEMDEGEQPMGMTRVYAMEKINMEHIPLHMS